MKKDKMPGLAKEATSQPKGGYSTAPEAKSKKINSDKMPHEIMAEKMNKKLGC